ncbi:MAG: glycogen/starch synthase [Muribaculaceae bacterium]|nr:glycogen/starch synthase [Muribaculaceae bacterium]
MPDNKRILFVSQEIAPYLSKSEISNLGRELPQAMQEAGYEPRIFMPKYGTVNERRNQLHEVIRLSGMNIPIADADHPLILKVASMQPSRIQVYFIDNDDYFQKSDTDADAVGSNRDDNDERAIFFARGTMETVKKLRWEPRIVHCTGWMTALSPMYLRQMYADDPSFDGARIVYSVVPGEITGNIDPKIFEKLLADGASEEDLKAFANAPLDTALFHKLAIRYADGVIFRVDEPDPELLEFARNRNLPILMKDDVEGKPEAYDAFYKQVMG